MSLIVCVWKLKGLRAPPPGGGGTPALPSLLNAGLATLAGEFIEEFIDPKRVGKVSIIGDKALGSNVMVERTVRETPSIPRLLSCSSGIGVGGVGVRGGAGIGRLKAISLSMYLEVS